jgi:hypothetical protein
MSSDNLATRAFSLKAPPKFSQFKNRHPVPAPETSAPTVPSSDNYLSELATDTKNCTSNGNHLHIDFQGDFRPILMGLMYYAVNNYDALDQKQNSKISPPTFTAYFLFVIYAFYLLVDLDIRPTPSKHTDFMSVPEYIELKQFLLSLPVPDFLIKFLAAITPTADPRRPNITVAPTFACWSYKHDFGRFFPINIFILSHNFVLSKRTNDAPENLLNQMMQLTVYRDDRIGNYFGQLLESEATYHNYGHQLFQAFEGIINPAVARARSNRTSYARSNTYIDNETLPNDLNPYQFLMNIDRNNVSETQTLMRQIANNVEQKLNAKQKLGNVISSLTGMNIMIHSYNDYALPTWHSNNIPTSISDDANITTSNGKDIATRLKFLQLPDRTPDTELKYPTDDTVIDKILYLVKKGKKDAKKGPHFPDDHDFIIFRSRSDDRPPHRILDPYDYNPTTFSNVILSGAMIESRSLDGHAVPMPDTQLDLDSENTLFLQSSLPYSDICLGTAFTANPDPIWYAERRYTDPSKGQKCTTMLYDLTENRLPHFDQNIHGPIPATLPGFHPRDHVSLWSQIYSKIGFYIPTSDSKDRNRPNAHRKNAFLAWSPYRYFNGKAMNSQFENYFMIMNLRTVYGTNPSLGEISHFLDTIPVS